MKCGDPRVITVKAAAKKAQHGGCSASQPAHEPRCGGCHEVTWVTQTARELGRPLVAWLSV